MKSHNDLSNEQFLEQFENATMDPNMFDHEAHLRLAWLHLDRFSIDIAIKNIAFQLRNYTRKLGAEDKYNETVTVAAVKAVYHFKLKSNSEEFQEFIMEFPRLKTNFKDLLAQHYGFDLFTNEEAKSSFIAPDLLPFD